MLQRFHGGETNCWHFLLTTSLRQRRMLMYISLFKVAIPVNYISILGTFWSYYILSSHLFIILPYKTNCVCICAHGVCVCIHTYTHIYIYWLGFTYKISNLFWRNLDLRVYTKSCWRNKNFFSIWITHYIKMKVKFTNLLKTKHAKIRY